MALAPTSITARLRVELLSRVPSSCVSPLQGPGTGGLKAGLLAVHVTRPPSPVVWIECLPVRPLHLFIRYRRDGSGPILERDLGPYATAWNGGISIGSDSGCVVCLSGDDVSPRHAVAERQGHHTYLTPLAPVALEGTPITTRLRIDQRPFRVGPWLVQFGESSTPNGTYTQDLDP